VEQIIGELSLMQILIPVFILAAFCGLAWLLRWLFAKLVRRLTQKTRPKLGDRLLSELRKPLVATIIAVGLFVAVLTLPQEFAVWSYTAKGLATALSLLGIFLVLIFMDAIIRWYRQRVIASKKDFGFGMRLISLCWVAMIFVAIWLGIMASFSIWGLDVTIVTGWLGNHGWRIGLIVGIGVLAIVAMGEVIPRVVTRTLTRRPDETKSEVKKRSDTLSRVLVGTSQVFIFFIAIFMILSELEIDIAPILAGAGVVGLAIGFGAQGLVKDLVAGIFVITENHYRVGDVVGIAGVTGVVENISLRRTTLRDLEGIVHIVPNGEIRVASNYTKDRSTVNLNISVAYKEDLNRVISIINKVGKELAEDPAWSSIIVKVPQVLRVDNLGDSGIDIKILGDTQPMRQWDVMGELRLRLKNTFDKEDIEIPWPHIKVYFGDTPLPSNIGQAIKKK